MKFTLSWLKDHLDTSASVTVLAETFAMSVSIAVVTSMPSTAQQNAKLDVPIVLGGNDDDACRSVGIVVGLDPKGDGFLSVRSGPGGSPYREIDRLFNGNRIYICGNSGPWLSVVYPAGGIDCGVSASWPVRQPYTGPCRHGWVHSRYVKTVAG